MIAESNISESTQRTKSTKQQLRGAMIGTASHRALGLGIEPTATRSQWRKMREI